jgi:hypothetical protein
MTKEQYQNLKKHLDIISDLVSDGYINLGKDKDGKWDGSHWTLFEAINDSAIDAMGYIDETSGLD